MELAWLEDTRITGRMLDVQMRFNQMPFDDAEDECFMWGNDSFLCSRFSFVKSVGGLENAENLFWEKVPLNQWV